MKSESFNEFQLLSPVYLLLHGPGHNLFGFDSMTNKCL